MLDAIGSHPNAAVRLFNPFVVRSPRWIGHLTDFGRANRRMCNKSFTADGQATIVDGRNVGDEYFGVTDAVLFTDFDLIAIGPAAREVSDDFERDWSCASACPVAAILPPVDATLREVLRALAAAIEHDARATADVEALETSTSIDALVRGDRDFVWAPERLVSDDPAKGIARARDDELLYRQFGEVIGEPSRALDTCDVDVPERAYEVRLDGDGRLSWLERVDGRTVRHDTEPGTTALQRFGISVLSLLPIESMP